MVNNFSFQVEPGCAVFYAIENDSFELVELILKKDDDLQKRVEEVKDIIKRLVVSTVCSKYWFTSLVFHISKRQKNFLYASLFGEL